MPLACPRAAPARDGSCLGHLPSDLVRSEIPLLGGHTLALASKTMRNLLQTRHEIPRHASRRKRFEALLPGNRFLTSLATRTLRPERRPACEYLESTPCFTIPLRPLSWTVR